MLDGLTYSLSDINYVWLWHLMYNNTSVQIMIISYVCYNE